MWTTIGVILFAANLFCGLKKPFDSVAAMNITVAASIALSMVI